MRMMTLSLTAVLAAALAGPVLAQEDEALTIQQSDTHGAYIADSGGQALYLFTADQQGKENSEAQTACTGECAQAWPPYTIDGEPQIGGQLDQKLVGTLERDDGSTQLTYGGWPLYYFVKDQAPGDVNGQDVHGFDGEWYLVSPEGGQNDTY